MAEQKVSALRVLERLFENESMLPKRNPTALLKSIGWAFSEGVKRPPEDCDFGFMEDMFMDLLTRDGGNRQATMGEFVYREWMPGMHSENSAYKTSKILGWHLQTVRQLYDCGELEGGSFVFTYTMPPPKGHVPLEPDPAPCPLDQWQRYKERHNRRAIIWDSACQRSFIFQKFNDEDYLATFELAGVRLYMMESEGQTAVVLAPRDGASSFGSKKPWDLEFVVLTDQSYFVHGLYNSGTRVASANRTYVNHFWVHHAMQSFDDHNKEAWPAPYQVKFPYETNGLCKMHRLLLLLNMDGGACLEPSTVHNNMTDIHRCISYIASLIVGGGMWRDGMPFVCDKISEALTQQLRRRLAHVARTFLLKSAELAEQRRAADPVRKCAACAIEAVKSQIALGIEGPAAKRQRT